MLAAAGPASAGGLTEAGELHAARLNANAGGPVSAPPHANRLTIGPKIIGVQIA